MSDTATTDDATPPAPMDLAEFVEDGYLQECNRLFLHPLGLALCMAHDEISGGYELASVLDARQDPEGFVFAAEDLETDEMLVKAQRIRDELLERAEDRLDCLDAVVQPIPSLGDEPYEHAGALLVRLNKLVEAVTRATDLTALREDAAYVGALRLLDRFPM